MDPEFEGEESPHKLDEKIVNINDYSQNGKHQQSQSSKSFQDWNANAFKQVLEEEQNQLFKNQDHQDNQIQHLQSKLQILENHNHSLVGKVQQLYKEINMYQELTQEDSKEKELIEFFEKQVSEFKKSFEEFRNKQIKINEEKDNEIQKLRQELDRVIDQRNEIQEEKTSLLQSNQDLIKNNQNLILQIQKLQNQLVQSRSEINSSRTYRFSTRRDHGFESQVQAELQKLIEKLMSQLQLQRNQKKRMNEEIKRIQKEALVLQKEITAKNNKIYQLQMNSLKQNRSSKNNQTYATSKYTKVSRQNITNKNDRTSSLRNLTLIQLLNEDLSDKQRLIISSKVIDFYSRKIHSKEYSSFQLENLLACNYNKNNPNLISIRKDTNAVLSQSTQQKMLYSLGQILDLFLGQYLNEVKQVDSGEEYLLNLINELLNDKNVNINDVYVIKQLIQDCLKSRK